MDCLTNIVGLSNTDCDCWDDTKPVDFNTLNASSSGLYISEPKTVPLRMVGGSADCENGGIWDLLIKARDGEDGRGGAVRDFVKDFLGATQRVKHNQFLPFEHIGDNYYTKAKYVNGSLAGMFFEPYRIKGGKLRISSIDLAFFSGITAPSTDIDISIYSSLNFNTPLAVATATVTGNKEFFRATLSSELVIDLGEIRDDVDQRIYILYEIPTGALPVANNTEIKVCCGSNKFERNPYLQLMCNLTGVQTDNLSNITTRVLDTSTTMNGLYINASFECDYYSWLCELAQAPNESYGVGAGDRVPLGMALADGLRAKCVMNLIDSLLLGTRINQYSMIQDPKQLLRQRAIYKNIYSLAIDNLVYYMPSDVTDCLVCAKNNKLAKKPLLA